MATNHFGPFLLTGLLLPQLVASEAATVVTVSSNYHRMARSAPLGDPTVQAGRYRKWGAYAQSKLANLLFTYELDRRSREAGLPVKAMAAHPGFAGTHLAANGQYGRSSGGIASILDAAVKAMSQSAAAGAWPTLMAATADLPGGTYVGPGGLGQMGGAPAGGDVHLALAGRREPAPALGAQRADDRRQLPLSITVGCLAAAPDDALEHPTRRLVVVTELVDESILERAQVPKARRPRTLGPPRCSAPPWPDRRAGPAPSPGSPDRPGRGSAPPSTAG